MLATHPATPCSPPRVHTQAPVGAQRLQLLSQCGRVRGGLRPCLPQGVEGAGCRTTGKQRPQDPATAPVSRRTLLTKHRLKGKIIKNFTMATTEYEPQVSSWGPCLSLERVLRTYTGYKLSKPAPVMSSSTQSGTLNEQVGNLITPSICIGRIFQWQTLT